MYPLEENINGDYVELVHFLNSLNRRFIIVSGKDGKAFEDYIQNGFSDTLKIIKSSKNQKELESNLNLLFDHYEPKLADILAGKGEMQTKVENAFREMGKIKAEEKAKSEWQIKGISQRKIDEVSEELLSEKKQLKNAVNNLHNAKEITTDKEKLALMLKSSGMSEQEFKSRLLKAYEGYAKELRNHREKYHSLVLDYNEMLFENVAIAEVNEKRYSVKHTVNTANMETA